MKIQPRNRLVLSKETLRSLSSVELALARGAGVYDVFVPPGSVGVACPTGGPSVFVDPAGTASLGGVGCMPGGGELPRSGGISNQGGGLAGQG